MLKAIKSRSRDLLMVTVDVIAGVLDAGPADEPKLLDLSHLNDDEVSIIKLVLEKDEKLIEEERIRLRNLNESIEIARSHQKHQTTSLKCSVCGSKSCRNRNECSACHYMVCNKCKLKPSQEQILCKVCYATGVYHVQSLSRKSRKLQGSALLRESLQSRLKQATPVPDKKVLPQSDQESLEPSPVPPTLSSIPTDTIISSSPNRGPSELTSEEDVVTKETAAISAKSDSEDEVKSKLPQIMISADSFDSLASLYSNAGTVDCDLEIKGEVLVGVERKERKLFVHIVRAKDLMGVNSNGLSNPYIKVYVLPDYSKKSKRKTSVKRRTVDPVYNEIMKYKLRTTDFSALTVWLSVWNFDAFGRNVFLGEIRLPLSTLDVNGDHPFWYPLNNKEEKNPKKELMGKIQIGVTYKPDEGNPSNGYLQVSIKQATLHHTALLPPDSFITCHLLPDKESKLKTSVKPKSVNPKWNEDLFFAAVSKNDLAKNRALELAVWDYSKKYGSTFLGGVRIGPFAPMIADWMDSSGQEVDQWQAMLNNDEKCVESWYTLRLNMNPRSPDMGSCKPKFPPSLTGNEMEEEQLNISTADILETDSDSDSTHSSSSQGSMQQSDLVRSDLPNLLGVTGNESLIGSMISFNSKFAPPKGNYQITGDVLVALEKINQNLLIHVNKARGLAAADKNGLSDPYVKTYLLPEESRQWKRKTSIKYKTLNPVYNETLKYQMPRNSSYSSYIIWLSVWDNDVIGKNRFLGEVYIPLFNLDLEEDTYKQWYPLKDHVKMQYSASHQVLTLKERSSSSSTVVDNEFTIQVASSSTSTEQGDTRSLCTPLVGENSAAVTDKSVPALELNLDNSKEEPLDSVAPLIHEDKDSATVGAQLLDVPHSTPTASSVEQKKTNRFSMVSMDSSASYAHLKGNYEITGEIMVGVSYGNEEMLLHINQARNLAVADRNGYSDPYVKVYLLPNLNPRSKRKSSTKKHTLDPVYNEVLKYKLTENEVQSTIIWLSVWHHDRLGKNKFLGEARIPMSTLNFTTYEEQWYTLMDKTPEFQQMSVPELEASFCVIPVSEDSKLCTLNINIKEARNISSLTNATVPIYVKCYLLPGRSSSTKRKTKQILFQHHSPLLWEEELQYDKLDKQKFAKRQLEISLWSVHGSRNEPICLFYLGDSEEEEKRIWNELFSKPNKWITCYCKVKSDKK